MQPPIDNTFKNSHTKVNEGVSEPDLDETLGEVCVVYEESKSTSFSSFWSFPGCEQAYVHLLCPLEL